MSSKQYCSSCRKLKEVVFSIPHSDSYIFFCEDCVPLEPPIEEFNKKANYVYLAGNISDDVRTYEWREQFTSLVSDIIRQGRLKVVDPCANPFNQSLKNSDECGLDFVREAVRRSQRILRAKDYQLVKMCNLMVANLGLFSLEKPMIGTVQELAWARDILYIPVIGITLGKECVYTNHPWIDECCSAKVETVVDAANMVKEFFLDY